MNSRNEYEHRLTRLLNRLQIGDYHFEDRRKHRALHVTWRGRSHTTFFPKTGSDRRGARNAVQDLRRQLGITKEDFIMNGHKTKPIVGNSFKVLEVLKPKIEVKPMDTKIESRVLPALNVNGNGGNLQAEIVRIRAENERLRHTPRPQFDLATRIMDVLEEHSDGWLTLKEIAERTGASVAGANVHMMALRKANRVVRSRPTFIREWSAIHPWIASRTFLLLPTFRRLRRPYVRPNRRPLTSPRCLSRRRRAHLRKTSPTSSSRPRQPLNCNPIRACAHSGASSPLVPANRSKPRCPAIG
jgi:hypothetical protein